MKGLYRRGRIWWLRYSLGGKQRFVSLDTDLEWEAIQQATKIQVVNAPARASITAGAIDTHIDNYLAESAGRLSSNTRAARGNVLLAFAEFADGSSVTPKLVERWNAHLSGTIANVTRATYLRWLKTFFDWMVERRRVALNPVQVEIDERPYSPRKPFCSKEQVRAIIQAAPDPQLRFILYCGFHAGLRREEIAQARPHWFDLDNGLLHVQRSDTWHPKDKTDRTIPLTEEFADFLRLCYGLPEPFMIEPNKKEGGRWRYRYDFRRPFDTLIARLKVVPMVRHGKKDASMTIHTMRHTFASLRVSAGRSIYKVAMWLGDGVAVAERHYAYLTPKDSDVEI